MRVTSPHVDPVEALGRFAARADAERMAYLPLTVSGLSADEMGRLVSLGLAEADKRGAYRLTSRGQDVAVDLAGPGAFDLAGRLAAARSVAGDRAADAEVARAAVLLTSDDELRTALRVALVELLGVRRRDAADEPVAQPARRLVRDGAAPLPKPSRWENLSDVLSCQRVIVATGERSAKVLAACTPADLRQASTYYAASAAEATKRAAACAALVELMALYEADTVADLERAAPQKFAEVWS